MSKAFVIYTYGGGEILYNAFNAIATLFKDNSFAYSFYISAVLFAIWVLINSITKNDPLASIKWMFWFWISTTLIIAPKTTILIQDPITKFERDVDNVPYVLGAFAGVVSSLGHGITDRVETFFKLPDYHKYGENGPVFASKILKNMNKYKIRDGIFKENMDRFIHQCMVLESMSGGKYTIDDLNKATDIWALVRDNANPINGFMYRSSSGGGAESVTCKEGAQQIDRDFQSATKHLSSYFGRLYNPNSVTTSDIAMGNFFKEKLQSSYQFMSKIGDSAEDILKQEMMINAIDDVKHSYAVSKATIQQKSWHLVTGELASNFLVSMKIVLETLAYSGFIFIALLIMLPSGFNVLGKYFGILLWLQLWAPLYAVLNMVMSIVAQYQTKSLLAGEGLTLLTSAGLSGLHADIEAIAAMCSASIPFISYSLLQGGVGAFMHMAGTMTSAMSGAAQGAASEVTSGNLGLNSISYGGRQIMNSAGFKHDTSLSYKSGRMEMENMSGSQSFTTGSGRLGSVAGQGYTTSKLPDQATIQRAINTSYNSVLANEGSILKGHVDSYDKAKTMTIDNGKNLLASMGKGVGQTRDWQISSSSRYADSINKTAQFTESFAKNKGYTSAQAAEIALSLGLGKIGFGPHSSFSSKASYEEAIQKGKNYAETQGLSWHLELGATHLDDVKYSGNKSEEKRISDNVSVGLNTMQRASQQANILQSNIDRINRVRQVADSLGIGIKQDATEKFIDYASKQSSGNGLPLGREGALYVMTDPNRAFNYMHLIDQFASDVAKETLTQYKPNDVVEGLGNQQGSHYQKIAKDKKQEFHDDISEGKGDVKGEFIGEQAKIQTGEKKEIADGVLPQSTVFENTQKSLVTNSNTAKENDLKIHSSLEGETANKTYQTYTPHGSNKPINIVEEVRENHASVKPKIEQQEAALKGEESNLQGKYSTETNTPRALKAGSKAVESTLDVVEPALTTTIDVREAKGDHSNAEQIRNDRDKTIDRIKSGVSAVKNALNTDISDSPSNKSAGKLFTKPTDSTDPKSLAQNTDFVDFNSNKAATVSPKTFAEEKTDNEQRLARLENENKREQPRNTDIKNPDLNQKSWIEETLGKEAVSPNKQQKKQKSRSDSGMKKELEKIKELTDQ